MFVERPLFLFYKEKNPGAKPLEVFRCWLNALKDVLTFALMPRIVSCSDLEYF